MGNIGGTRSTFGKITTTQKVVDLPAATSNPEEIDCSSHLVTQIFLYVSTAFHYCVAEDQTAANTAIGSDTTRGYLPAGVYSIPVAGTSNKFYLRASSGALVTDGISYSLIEED